MQKTSRRTVSVSIRRDLMEWVERNKVSVSSFVNAALDILRRAGLVVRTNDSGEALFYLLVAALRTLGVDATPEDVNEIFAGRKKVVIA